MSIKLGKAKSDAIYHDYLSMLNSKTGYTTREIQVALCSKYGLKRSTYYDHSLGRLKKESKNDIAIEKPIDINNKVSIYKKPKVLFFDIETFANLSFTWGKWEQNVIDFEREWFVLCFCYKWLGEKTVHSVSLPDFDLYNKDKFNDYEVIKEMWNLFNEADVVVGHNCIEENTKVLTKSLNWIPAKDLKIGDELLAFEEGIIPGQNFRDKNNNWNGIDKSVRKLIDSTITDYKIEEAECYDVLLSNGEIITTTSDHFWIAKTQKDNMHKWIQTSELKSGFRITKFMDVWEEDKSYEAGWLSGFISGEGTLKQSGKSFTVDFCQRKGKTLDKAINYSEKLGYKLADLKSKGNGLGKGDTQYTYFHGGKFKNLEILGRLQIDRLINNIKWDSLGGLKTQQTNREMTVISVTPSGKKKIVVMSTTSKTFFAEGYAMHNCDKFDVKKMYARFLYHRLGPPEPFKSIDTLKIARQKFSLNSNKLDDIGRYLGVGRKVVHTGWDLWKRCSLGDMKAWKEMCMTPDHKLLGTDLIWKEAREFKVGDHILGFDENGPYRKYKDSEILSIDYSIEPLYEVTFKSGKKFRTTIDHKWLCVNWTHDRVGSFKWKRTDELYFGGKNLLGIKPTNMIHINDSIPKLFDVWEEDKSYEAGWLAGMFDGEGSLHNRKASNSGMRITISQKDGNELNKVKELINKFSNSGYFEVIRQPKENELGKLNNHTIGLNGRMQDRVSFLGKIQPKRLINKVDFNRFGRLESRDIKDEVVDIKKIEDGEIIMIKTSTNTFISDGYPMHNCDYNKQDVILLEKVYNEFLPYITNHPNMNLYNETLYCCPNCSSNSVQKRGYAMTRISKSQRYQCMDCGAWSQNPISGGKIIR